ncbi:MAG: hypothetical protein Q9171_002097 [Xanthocarpia ochracea]
MPSPTSFDRRASPSRSSYRQSHRSSRSYSRSRSRSPPPPRRNDDRPRVSTGGFRWKDKSRDTDRRDRPEGGALQRGYRERDRGERNRDADRDRDRNSYRDADSRRNRDTDVYRDRDENSRSGKYDGRDLYDNASRGPRRVSRSPTPVADQTFNTTGPDKSRREKKDKRPKAAKIAPTAQPMIIVNVNDRLGTKTAIPCLASDSIGNHFYPSLEQQARLMKLGRGWLTMRVGDFKKLVGAHIGRKPHEIMLKRQGERPFKDILTLEDYGVSNGVQLDLEVDTGD